jgi:hypothetical protein
MPDLVDTPIRIKQQLIIFAVCCRCRRRRFIVVTIGVRVGSGGCSHGQDLFGIIKQWLNLSTV